MKANKALKRLAKIEASLSDLIERYAASEEGVKELLHDAKASVLRAKKAVGLQKSSRTATGASVKARKPKRRHLTAEGRKRISLAAKQKPVQTTNKAAGKVTRKKSATPVVKGATRAKTAKPTVAKKAAVKATVKNVAKKAAAKAPVKRVAKKVAAKVPVKQVAKKVAAKASFRKVEKKVPAKAVIETAAPRTKNIVKGPEQAVPVPETPAQDRATGEASVGLPGEPRSV
jgi:hypothetical protein